ncbi:hypothetical protein P153DRAFT_367280 [Dothidotthia symphoricarpi CBS 119687]|uniref:Uncharacterized protein n=1 Tax=Dothidotthia symphoricarpi CBS 119687 TaxID=1392245 RepID=A0A6A6ACZ8_9PLEO|nr:uncharacterized protein P153DRAFT_367280 [Dothidotthia symphoricarpi CBS 119687]KAF2128995.1 hypothetical protein P153DRAFT_367280 [Dothidotthia symphoricarpi CBS 119687]
MYKSRLPSIPSPIQFSPSQPSSKLSPYTPSKTTQHAPPPRPNNAPLPAKKQG